MSIAVCGPRLFLQTIIEQYPGRVTGQSPLLQSRLRNEELMKKQTIGAAGMTNPIPSHPLATRAGPFLFMSGQMGLSEASGRPFRSYQELGG